MTLDTGHVQCGHLEAMSVELLYHILTPMGHDESFKLVAPASSDMSAVSLQLNCAGPLQGHVLKRNMWCCPVGKLSFLPSGPGPNEACDCLWG